MRTYDVEGLLTCVRACEVPSVRMCTSWAAGLVTEVFPCARFSVCAYVSACIRACVCSICEGSLRLDSGSESAF